MITRDIESTHYTAGCKGAPPPLHVTPAHGGQAWWPVERPRFRNQPPGPELIHAPVVAPFGDDPTDPAAQTFPRRPTSGMLSRFNVGPSGVRST